MCHGYSGTGIELMHTGKRGSVRSVYWCTLLVEGSKTNRLRRMIDQRGAGRAVQDEANAATKNTPVIYLKSARAR